MSDTPVETRKRKNSSSGESLEQKKKLRKPKKTPTADDLTEDEVLDPDNDRTYEQREAWLKRQTVKKLGNICSENNIKKGGNKPEIIERLLLFLCPFGRNPPVQEAESPKQTDTKPESELKSTPPRTFNAQNSALADAAQEPSAPPSTTQGERKQTTPPDEQSPSSTAHTVDLDDHPRRKLPIPSDLTKIKRQYPSAELTVIDLVTEKLHSDASRFSQDLKELSLDQVRMCYCYLAQRVQNLAHNSTPALDLKDRKALADVEKSETAFMAMDVLERNFELMASLAWHHTEIAAQRKIMYDQAEYIKQLQREKEHDADFFTKKLEGATKPNTGVSAASPLPRSRTRPAVALDVPREQVRESSKATEATELVEIAEEAEISTSVPAETPEAATIPSTEQFVTKRTILQRTTNATHSGNEEPEVSISTTQASLPGLTAIIPDSQDDEESQPVLPAILSRATTPNPSINEPALRPALSPITLLESPIDPRSTDDVHPSNLAPSPVSSAQLRPAPPPPTRTSTPAISDCSGEEAPSRALSLEEYRDEGASPVDELFEVEVAGEGVELAEVGEGVVIEAHAEEGEQDADGDEDLESEAP